MVWNDQTLCTERPKINDVTTSLFLNINAPNNCKLIYDLLPIIV